MNYGKVKCPWCTREGLPLTKKGALAPHMGLGGLPCMMAVRIGKDSRTPPRRIKGTVQRNSVRR